jgi:hypothetical protein
MRRCPSRSLLPEGTFWRSSNSRHGDEVPLGKRDLLVAQLPPRLPTKRLGGLGSLGALGSLAETIPYGRNF